MEPLLSILICSLTARDASLQRLLGILIPQCNGQPVEIVVEKDEGQLSIGQKRQRLLECAKGQYMAFVDDDDAVSTDYVDEITWALRCCPTATHCSLRGYLLQEQHKRRLFEHSNKYKEWGTVNNVFVRPPNHLNVIRRDLALEAGFENLSWSEDKLYSEKLVQLDCLTHEAWIEPILYYYYYTVKPKVRT